MIFRLLTGGTLLLFGTLVSVLMLAILANEVSSSLQTSASWILGYAFFLSLGSCAVIGGYRLLLNRPHALGGIFSPNMLRYLAIVNALLGGVGAILSWNQRDWVGVLSSVTYFLTTQAAFALANLRESRSDA